MIHQYKNNGYNIVLDVNSGSVHVVDDVVYDTLSMLDENDENKFSGENTEKITKEILKKYSAETLTERDMEEIFSDLRELEKNGTLFAKDVYQNGVIDFKQRQTDRKSVV